MANIDATLLGVTNDDEAAFTAMTNTVYLAAQLEVKGGFDSSIKKLFDKQAKYYYGVQTTDSGDKRMYRKNTAKMAQERLSTEDARKDLDTVPGNDIAKVENVKTGIDGILRADTSTNASTQDFFDATQIAEGGKVNMGTGARVALIAKYSIAGEKVSAFGKLVFIKATGEKTASLNLVIKDNTIMTGSSVGAGIYMSKLLQTLFGAGQEFIFDENSLTPGAEAAQQVAAQQVAAQQVAAQDVVDGDGAGDAAVAAARQEEARSFGLGGKSTRRKRKGSRKKGSSKKPVSHKKRKSGASKKRRSHPKKK